MKTIQINKPMVFKADRMSILHACGGVLLNGCRTPSVMVVEEGSRVKISGTGSLLVWSSEVEVAEEQPSEHARTQNSAYLHRLLDGLHNRVEHILSASSMDSAMVELTILSVDLARAKGEYLAFSKTDIEY